MDIPCKVMRCILAGHILSAPHPSTHSIEVVPVRPSICFVVDIILAGRIAFCFVSVTSSSVRLSIHLAESIYLRCYSFNTHFIASTTVVVVTYLPIDGILYTYIYIYL